MSQRCEVAVVGRGLIGSAAARHLAEAGVSVALFGSAEAANYSASQGPFASHYDEGRITRISSGSPIWAELAVRSISRYPDIAMRSGIDFHDACGLVWASQTALSDRIDAVGRGADVRPVTLDWVQENTGIRLPAAHAETTMFEGPPAGRINPRRLIAAQTQLAVSAGAALVEQAVIAISEESSRFVIRTAEGVLEAKRVLLATGAYGAGLIGVDLAIERRLRTILMVELSPNPAPSRPLPSLIVHNVGHPALEEIYWVPPVLYPDGRMMLKIGGDSLPLISASTDQEITDWFHAGGSAAEATALRQIVETFLPDATITSAVNKPCVVAYTLSQVPYIGWVADGVAVAVGGNGSAAKSSDELGRLAATLFSPEGWTDPDLEAGDFAPQID